MTFEVFHSDQGVWVNFWHAFTSTDTWEELCQEASRWIGPVRMVDKNGLVVREFWPCRKT